jgi:hypothetical protein
MDKNAGVDEREVEEVRRSGTDLPSEASLVNLLVQIQHSTPQPHAPCRRSVYLSARKGTPTANRGNIAAPQPRTSQGHQSKPLQLGSLMPPSSAAGPLHRHVSRRFPSKRPKGDTYSQQRGILLRLNPDIIKSPIEAFATREPEATKFSCWASVPTRIP